MILISIHINSAGHIFLSLLSNLSSYIHSLWKTSLLWNGSGARPNHRNVHVILDALCWNWPGCHSIIDASLLPGVIFKQLKKTNIWLSEINGVLTSRKNRSTPEKCCQAEIKWLWEHSQYSFLTSSTSETRLKIKNSTKQKKKNPPNWMRLSISVLTYSSKSPLKHVCFKCSPIEPSHKAGEVWAIWEMDGKLLLLLLLLLLSRSKRTWGHLKIAGGSVW